MLLPYIAILRSSRPEMFCKKGFLRHFAKFIGKLLCWSLFFHKVVGRLEKRLQHSCFSVNFTRFFRTTILYSICERLLLVLVRITLVWRAANLLMFCIIVCKSVNIEMQFSTDFTLMSTQPTY